MRLPAATRSSAARRDALKRSRARGRKPSGGRGVRPFCKREADRARSRRQRCSAEARQEASVDMSARQEANCGSGKGIRLEEPVGSPRLQVAWPAAPRRRAEVCVGGHELGTSSQLVARPTFQVTSNKPLGGARPYSQFGMAVLDAKPPRTTLLVALARRCKSE
jgi:hypothetical protein